MRIFYDHLIFNLQNFGGISRYVVNLASNLNNINDAKIKIFAPIHLNYHLKKFDNKRRLFFPSNLNFIKKTMMNINDKLFSSSLNKYKPDIFHTTYYSKKERYLNIPKILTVHDLTHEKISKDKKFLPKKESIESSDHIICVSNSTKNDLQEFYNVSDNKISVIYESSGISTNLINKSNITKNLKPFLLYVGSRHGYKNFDNLVIAFSNSEFLKNNYNIIFFGGGKINQDEKKIISDLKIEKNLIFTEGSDKNLANLYSRCEAFVYPSIYEGFGITLLEALSFNTKIICSDIPPFKEVCGDAAIYFNPKSFEDIKSKLENCLKNKINYSFDYKEEILKNFSWKKCAEETFEVYKKNL